MLLSGCKGNTFFWKSTFFYGLICIQSEKIQKTAWFHQLTDSINEGSETAKTSVFVAKRNRTVGIFTQKFIRFDIGSGTTFIASPTLHKKDEKEIIYNLNGQQVDKTSTQGGIFISRQKGKFYKASGSSGGRR